MTKEELLTRTLEDLGKQYSIGLYEFLFKHHPDPYRQLIDLEDRIDQTYLNPSASIDQLKAVLREYWTLHMTTIEEFMQRVQLNLNPLQVKEEMAEERIRA